MLQYIAIQKYSSDLWILINVLNANTTAVFLPGIYSSRPYFLRFLPSNNFEYEITGTCFVWLIWMCLLHVDLLSQISSQGNSTRGKGLLVQAQTDMTNFDLVHQIVGLFAILKYTYKTFTNQNVYNLSKGCFFVMHKCNHV